MKQLNNQIVIFKLSAALIKSNGWDLHIDYETARREGMVATQGDDSQLFTFCEKLEPFTTIEESKKNSELKTGYRFTETVIAITFLSNKEYDECCKNVKVNGNVYKRIVGTTGGIKNDTILFLREDIHNVVYGWSNNDAKMKDMVVAKWEAYKALMCSSSHPVTLPKDRILVVNDCITNFKEDVLYVDDTSGTPQVIVKKDMDIELNANDGFGLARPCLFEQWTKDLQEDYLLSGACLRDFTLKGMCFPFEFEELATKLGNGYMVTDVWGNQKDLREVDLILTESMLKLWDCYDSIEHYIECCERNGFQLRVNKVVTDKLQDTRELNYQFLQSFELDDDDINELVTPTVLKIKKALCGDYKTTLEFLGANEKTEIGSNINCIDALLTSEQMMKDPYVRRSVYGMIKKKIDGAKIGKIEVNGDFQVISGDPYALVQSMLGVEVTGLLGANEIYTDYWDMLDVNEVLLFRAPMTSHNNIRKAKVTHSDECRYWYKYMKRITIISCKDTITMALNGADMDGDTFFSTNNPVLLRNYKPMLPIMCVQNKADKKKITEKEIIKSNKNGFSFARGEVVGSVTNRITSQIEVQSRFNKGTKEYEELGKRIICGQLYQQNSIDKLKGVKCNPMPKHWYNRRKCGNKFDELIVADKKPYFMIYIYPEEKKAYNKYMKEYNKKCLMAFGITMEQLKNQENITEEQQEFLEWYESNIPVGMGQCVMNRICWLIEKEFEGIRFDLDYTDFDYNILRSNAAYSQYQFKKVEEVYKEYLAETRNYRKETADIRIDRTESLAKKYLFIKHFKTKAENACKDDKVLCNIILDLCYQSESSKGFAWEMCKKQILENLRGNMECMS